MESINNKYMYSNFLADPKSFDTEIDKYLINRTYDLYSVDIIPLITANALQINIGVISMVQMDIINAYGLNVMPAGQDHCLCTRAIITTMASVP